MLLIIQLSTSVKMFKDLNFKVDTADTLQMCLDTYVTRSITLFMILYSL